MDSRLEHIAEELGEFWAANKDVRAPDWPPMYGMLPYDCMLVARMLKSYERALGFFAQGRDDWERTAREMQTVCEQQEAEIAALKAEVEWLRGQVAELEGEWVPVSTRLPEAYEMVWAATRNGRRVLAFYGLSKGWQAQIDYCLLDEVVAWTPVVWPKPPDAALRAAGLGGDE